MTIIELLVVMAILSVAVVIYTSMVVAVSRQRVLNRERTVATSAVRTVLEEMRNEPFQQVFALYNADPADDPEGPGSAPGSGFYVQGLELRDGSEFHGEVIFPAVVIEGLQEIVSELHEDFVDGGLGMPRDLNGDSQVDEANHATDYTLLPVRVRVDWSGRHGPRQLEICSQMSYYRRFGS